MLRSASLSGIGKTRTFAPITAEYVQKRWCFLWRVTERVSSPSAVADRLTCRSFRARASKGIYVLFTAGRGET